MGEGLRGRGSVGVDLTASRKTTRTLVVGGHDDPPKKVRLGVLSMLAKGLENAVSAIAADVGAAPFIQVDLVELLSQSSGLVFEQVVPESYTGLLVPLDIVMDGTAAYVTGRELPHILTNSGRDAIKQFVGVINGIRISGGPQVSVKTPSGDKIVVQDLGPFLEPSVLHPENIAAVSDTIGPIAEQTTRTDWLVTFTGVTERLDEKHRKMWVRVRGHGLRPLSLTDELFKAADGDAVRWKTVTVVVVSSSQSPKDARDVLHIKPFDGGPSDVAAVPIDEVAHEAKQSIEAIKALALLKNDWSGSGSGVVNVKSIKHASGFLILTASELRARATAVIWPFVAPVPNGNVQLEWDRGDAYLELEFHPDGTIEYLRAFKNESIEGRSSRETALGLVKWFHEKGGV